MQDDIRLCSEQDGSKKSGTDNIKADLLTLGLLGTWMSTSGKQQCLGLFQDSLEPPLDGQLRVIKLLQAPAQQSIFHQGLFHSDDVSSNSPRASLA